MSVLYSCDHDVEDDAIVVHKGPACPLCHVKGELKSAEEKVGEAEEKVESLEAQVSELEDAKGTIEGEIAYLKSELKSTHGLLDVDVDSL